LLRTNESFLHEFKGIHSVKKWRRNDVATVNIKAILLLELTKKLDFALS